MTARSSYRVNEAESFKVFTFPCAALSLSLRITPRRHQHPRGKTNTLLTGYLASLFSDLCLDSKVEVSPEAQEAAAEFVGAIFAILSSLNNVPKALALVLEGYLDRRHLWDHFCNLAGI